MANDLLGQLYLGEGDGHKGLQETFGCLAVAELPEALLTSITIAGHGRCIHADHLLLQVVDPHQMLPQLLLNGVPTGLIRQMPQYNREPIIGKIGLTNIQSRHLFQRTVSLPHPVAHRQFAMVALGDGGLAHYANGQISLTNTCQSHKVPLTHLMRDGIFVLYYARS